MKRKFKYIRSKSPLRKATDIDKCISFCVYSGADSCVSVTESEKSPFWMYYLQDNNRLKPVVETSMNYASRQQQQNVYVLNGAIYAAKTNWLLSERTFFDREKIAYKMARERSIDIDNELDLVIARILMNQNIDDFKGND